MPLTSDPFDDHVIGRVLEFASPATPWHRRLRHSGPLMTAAELLEAAESQTGETALRNLRTVLLDSLAGDEGLGRHRGAIGATVPKDPTELRPGSHGWHGMTAAIASARVGYLSRWADALRAAGGRARDPEFVAARISAHALDEGWSDSHLHRWLTYRVKYRDEQVELPDLLDEAEVDLRAAPREFEFCALLAQAPALPRPTPPGWLTGHEAAAWRRENVPDAEPIRQYGGVLLTVQAKDAYQAAEQVRRRLTDLVTRFAVGGRRELSFGPHLWVKGRPGSFPVEGSPRRVEVRAFERLDRLFADDIPDGLVSALTLIAPLDRGSPVAAITGAWAAVESLLVGPGDSGKGVAAERLALVVAASFVRAELTVLAWAHAGAASDSLSASLRAVADNRDRADLLERALADGAAPILKRSTDRWALERLRDPLRDATRCVQAIQSDLRAVFARLYRHRNLIVHGGKTNAVGSDAALRLAAPLVGAGLDRIAQALLQGDCGPLELAARARARLEVLGDADTARGSGVVDILG